MTAPLATTVVTISSQAGDPYEPKTPTIVSEHIRAHISAPSGTERLSGGSQETIDAKLLCDPVALSKNDLVTDESTGTEYEVVWVAQRKGLGLDHTAAGLRKTQGVAA